MYEDCNANCLAVADGRILHPDEGLSRLNFRDRYTKFAVVLSEYKYGNVPSLNNVWLPKAITNFRSGHNICQ